jgi:hypothetical protein
MVIENSSSTSFKIPGARNKNHSAFACAYLNQKYCMEKKYRKNPGSNANSPMHLDIHPPTYFDLVSSFTPFARCFMCRPVAASTTFVVAKLVD